MRELLRFLGSELRLIAGRRRNQVGMLVLMAPPVLVTIATKVSGHDRGGGGDAFFSRIAENGIFVAFAALTVEIGLFLPMGVAMVSGDAIAGEAQQGTLRYLLTVPVGRVRLLAVKYVAVVIGAVVAAFAVSVTGVVAGGVVFGVGPLTTLSGTRISLADGLWRLLLSTLYVAAGLAALAAVGVFVSTLTEQPIAVTVVGMVFTAGSWIADAIPQLSAVHPWLLVDRWNSFADLMRDPPLVSTIGTGLLVDAGYAVVFLLAAWASFAGKDITS